MIWALVAGSAMYWLLGLWSHGPVAPSYTVPIGEASGARGELSRLLGGLAVAPVNTPSAPPPEAANRFKLLGVVAGRDAKGQASGSGVAVIAVGDKPPRPFRVGASIDGQYMLRAVALRSASIGPASGAGGFTLELPPLAAAATGSLPSVSFEQPRFVPPPPPPPQADVYQPQIEPQMQLEPSQEPFIPEGAAPPGDGSRPPADGLSRGEVRRGTGIGPPRAAKVRRPRSCCRWRSAPAATGRAPRPRPPRSAALPRP